MLQSQSGLRLYIWHLKDFCSHVISALLETIYGLFLGHIFFFSGCSALNGTKVLGCCPCNRWPGSLAVPLKPLPAGQMCSHP